MSCFNPSKCFLVHPEWTSDGIFERTFYAFGPERKKLAGSSKVSHPRFVCINNRCRYQSITQQYLKRCLIKDDNNYMFRPIAAIIRFSSESMVVVLYGIGMVM